MELLTDDHSYRAQNVKKSLCRVKTEIEIFRGAR